MVGDCVVGIDLGTSGCRAAVIDAEHKEQANVSVPLPAPERHGCRSEQEPAIWRQAVLAVLSRANTALNSSCRIRCIAVDGTSASLLLTDRSGKPLSKALMYDDARALDQLSFIDSTAPSDSPVHSATSSLAKLLHLHQRIGRRNVLAHHQADWILGNLCGTYGISDENNCLKLGYDAQQRCWPDWTKSLGIRDGCLPRVLPPGTVVGSIAPAIAKTTGLAQDTLIATGTTDSTAAALAAGIRIPGEAVTVLGSTLVLKIVSKYPISAPAFGIYSHRIDDRWLVGGASNTGGAVCLRYFDPEQMQLLSARLDPSQPTGLDYYPLLRPGERFPVNDPNLIPCLTPRPNDDAVFFQGILEGIANIEKQGYQLLERLGAPHPLNVTTIGGGAANAAWHRIRENFLGIPVTIARHQQAAYGTALLAWRALEEHHLQ